MAAANGCSAVAAAAVSQQQGADVAILLARDQNPMEIPSSGTNSTSLLREEGASRRFCNTSASFPSVSSSSAALHQGRFQAEEEQQQQQDPEAGAQTAATRALSHLTLSEECTAAGASASNAPASSIPQRAAMPTPSPPSQPPQLPTRSSARKLKIMKRSDNQQHRSRSTTPNHNATATGGGSALKKSSSLVLSDKEKAYAEARARIFNTDESSSDAAADGATCQATAAQPSPISAPPASLESGGRSSSSSMGTRDFNSVPNPDHKAVYRNRLEEAADPDFRRGVVVVAPATTYPSSQSPVVNVHHGYYGSAPPYAVASAPPAVPVPLHPYSGPAAAIPAPAFAAGESSAPPQKAPWTAAAASAAPSRSTGRGFAGGVRGNGDSGGNRSSASTPRLAADAPAFYPSWARPSPSAAAAKPSTVAPAAARPSAGSG